MITNYAYFGGVYFNFLSPEEIIATPTERLGTGQFDVTICQWLICDVNIWQALVSVKYQAVQQYQQRLFSACTNWIV